MFDIQGTCIGKVSNHVQFTQEIIMRLQKGWFMLYGAELHFQQYNFRYKFAS